MSGDSNKHDTVEVKFSYESLSYLHNVIFLKNTLFVELYFLLLAYFYTSKIAICFTGNINNTKAIAVVTSAIYSRLNFVNSKITHELSIVQLE